MPITGSPKPKANKAGAPYWNNVINKLKQDGKIMIYTNLLSTEAVLKDDMTVLVEFPKGLTSFAKAVLEKHENVQELERLVSIEEGKPMRIKFVDAKNPSIDEPQVINNALENAIRK
ncbi:MAG: hypothetical protein LBL91_00120 [Lachnospiraceae bacterium]|nr:hypothetical protein [Lachnospiraceae bacterium]